MAKKNTKVAETEIVPQDQVTVTETTQPAVTPTHDMAALAEKHNNIKSAMIRELHADGVKTSDITKLMKTIYPKFIYQHARNVLNQKPKKSA